jgi:hypothetical protein
MGGLSHESQMVVLVFGDASNVAAGFPFFR